MPVKNPKAKNKYLVYLYNVYLNDVLYCEFARVEQAAYHAQSLAENRPDAHITVVREIDWEFTFLSLWDKLITDNVWVQSIICRFKGHLWDSDRPKGAIHERNVCWRCGSIRTETMDEYEAFNAAQ